MVIYDIQQKQRGKIGPRPMDVRILRKCYEYRDMFDGLFDGDMARIKPGYSEHYQSIGKREPGSPFADGAIIQISHIVVNVGGAFVYGGADKFAFVPAKYLERVRANQ